MADNYIISITYSLNDGNVFAEAAAAGRKAGDGFVSGFKPSLDVSKALNLGNIGRQTADAMRDGLASANLENVFSKPLRFFKAGIAGAAGAAIADATKKPIPVEVHAPAPRTPSHVPGAEHGQDFGEALLHQLHPFISGLEAFSLLMRGSPILSVLRATGYAASGVASAFEGRDAHGAAAPFVAKRASEETREERIERRLRGELPAAEGGVGEGAAAGGAAGIASRLGGVALRLGAVGALGFATAEGVKVVGELGVKGAETAEKLENMAESMGISTKELLTMRAEFAKSGVNVDDFTRAINRLNINAHRQMPAIEREVEDSSNVVAESNIKVAESERAVEKARDDRQAATDKTAKAEAELVKVQTTGADVIEQQRRSAELGVGGAGLSARAAETKAQEAQLNLQFAPQEAALEEVKGPLSVEGAKLGEKGAELGAASAQAKLKQLLTGEAPDPETEKRRALARARLNLEVARHNVEEARVKSEEADIAEQKRLQLPDAVERAQQKADEAEHAKDQANLRKDQAKTTRDRLVIDQGTNDLKMQERDAQRGVSEAKRGEKAAAEEQVKTRIAEDRATKEARLKAAEQITTIQGLIHGGALPEGVDIREIPEEQIRKAVLREGGGEAGPTIEALRGLLRNPAVEEEGRGKAKSLIQEVLPQRFGGGAEVEHLVNALVNPEKLSPEEQKRVDDFNDKLQEYLHSGQGKRLVEQEGTKREREFRDQTETQLVAGKPAERALKLEEDTNAAIEAAKRVPLQGLNKLDQLSDAMEPVAAGIREKGGELVNALGGVAQRLLSAGPLGSAGPVNANEDEGEGKAGGGKVTGRVSGAGSGTSDDVPINASPDEFIIKAERTRQLGVGFLNALNEGRVGMDEGGHVDEARKKKKKKDASTDHTEPFHIKGMTWNPDTRTWDEDNPAPSPSYAARPATATTSTQTQTRTYHGGYANALQRRLAESARKPDFDAKDRAAVTAYLERLRSGETPESIRQVDAENKLSSTAVLRQNPYYPGNEGATDVGPRLGYKENPFYRGENISGTGEKYEPPLSNESGTGSKPTSYDSETGEKVQNMFTGGSGDDDYAEGGLVTGPGGMPDEGAMYLRYEPEIIKAYLSSRAHQGISVAGLVGSSQPSYANGFSASESAGVGGGGGAFGGSMGFYQLDLKTSAGTLPVAVSDETMEGIRNSSLAGKLTQTGSKPSWYS